MTAGSGPLGDAGADDAADPRASATARLGGRYDTRVLEPSPPAVTEPPFFADDPVLDARADRGLPIVSPVGTGDLRWVQVAAEDPELAGFCREHWLGPYRRLEPAPSGLAGTRRALHALAERVIAPARRHANGKIGLRYTHGGFGTPFFGDDIQVRVQGAELVVDAPGATRRAPIATLAAAAGLIGRDRLPDDLDVDETELEVDPLAATLLGDWYGFAASVLEELRAGAGPEADPSRVQLWPEHFDMALELGSEATGARANYGFSPGDEDHPEPYVYVGPWVAPEPGALWNATGFPGAELSYAELVAAPDQRAAALEFMGTRLAALQG